MESFAHYLQALIERRATESGQDFDKSVRDLSAELGGKNVTPSMIYNWLDGAQVDEVRRIKIGRITAYDFIGWDIESAFQIVEKSPLGPVLHAEVRSIRTKEDVHAMIKRIMEVAGPQVLQRISGIDYQAWRYYASDKEHTARFPQLVRMVAVIKAAHIVLTAEAAGTIRDLRKMPEAKALDGRRVTVEDVDLSVPAGIDSRTSVAPSAPAPSLADPASLTCEEILEAFRKARADDPELYSNNALSALICRDPGTVRRWFKGDARPNENDLRKLIARFPEVVGVASASPPASSERLLAPVEQTQRPPAVVEAPDLGKLLGATLTGLRSSAAVFKGVAKAVPASFTGEHRDQVARIAIDLIITAGVTVADLENAAHGQPIERGSPLFALLSSVQGVSR